MRHDKNTVVGLDIGNSNIVVAIGSVSNDNIFSVLGIGRSKSDGIVNGRIINLSKATKSIKCAISEAELLSGITVRKANVSTFGIHFSTKMYHNSSSIKDVNYEISEDDVSSMKNDVFRLPTQDGLQLLDVIPQKYKVDYSSEIKDPVGMIGTRLEGDYYLLLSEKTTLSNINKCLQRCGIEIENVVISPVMSSSITISEKEKDAGICLIDIGGGNTDVIVFVGGIIKCVASIPFGGINITEDIKYGLNLSYDQAEQVKIKYGNAMSNNVNYDEVVSIETFDGSLKNISVYNLSQIIEARVREIIHFVQNQINDISANMIPAGIILTGGGSMLHSVRELVEQQTGIPTRIGEIMKNNIDVQDCDICILDATALGSMCYNIKNVSHDHKIINMKRTEGVFKKILKKIKGFLIDDYGTQQ